MIHLNTKPHAGFALLIFLVMMMGIGGFVLAGYSQGILKQVEASKFKHNQRVLKEAKAALLLYAYNYPENRPGNGPGRMPCPDTDNDGVPDATAYCKFVATGGVVGRFPWAELDMNFYEAHDAADERLWYVVSENFANNPAQEINSDTTGTITLFDQSQNIIYDGALAGIAAIIIAPGPVISRDEDNDGIYEYTQVRRTLAEQNDPRNYLDTFNNFDNSVFFNSLNTPSDGFIPGPVRERDPASPAVNTIVINDQMIVITADEVTEMAEKATLQAYRNSINDYLALTGNVYPWLYNYMGVPDVPGLSNLYPALADFTDPTLGIGERITYLDNVGRIPSIFASYFTETDSGPIQSKLSVALSLTYPITPTTVGSSASGLLQFNDPFPLPPIAHVLNIQTEYILTDVRFVDVADDAGKKNGQLSATVTTPEPFNSVIYFWDDEEGPPTGLWTACGDDGNNIPEVSDCNRDAAGNPTPGGVHMRKTEILRVSLDLDFNGVVNFETDYTVAPAVAAPLAATGASHASISGTFTSANIIIDSLPISVNYDIDRHYHAGDTFDIQETGTLDESDFIWGNLTLGMRYYPVLPGWAADYDNPDWTSGNGWHNSMMMAYANNLRPDIAGACIEADPLPANRCLTVKNMAGNIDTKISILVNAGQHDWNDTGAIGLADDVGDVFDLENEDLDDTFDVRAANGNDKVLVIDEL